MIVRSSLEYFRDHYTIICSNYEFTKNTFTILHLANITVSVKCLKNFDPHAVVVAISQGAHLGTLRAISGKLTLCNLRAIFGPYN